jgi:hypothetical protein
MNLIDWIKTLWPRETDKTSDLRDKVRHEAHRFNNKIMSVNTSLDQLVKEIKKKQGGGE